MLVIHNESIPKRAVGLRLVVAEKTRDCENLTASCGLLGAGVHFGSAASKRTSGG